MKQPFSTTQNIVKKVKKDFTKEQLSDLITKKKPIEIWHSLWSSKIPFIVITEYNEKGFLMYCNGAADKTPTQFDAETLYNFLEYQGLGDCYINIKSEEEGWEDYRQALYDRRHNKEQSAQTERGNEV